MINAPVRCFCMFLYLERRMMKAGAWAEHHPQGEELLSSLLCVLLHL